MVPNFCDWRALFTPACRLGMTATKASQSRRRLAEHLGKLHETEEGSFALKFCIDMSQCRAWHTVDLMQLA